MTRRRRSLALRPARPTDIDVVALGENSLDFVARLGSANGMPLPGMALNGKTALTGFSLQPGGQMATAALGCARLGLRARYIGAFGDDEWASRIRQPLERVGVDVVGIVRHGASSRIAVVLVDETGDRRVLEHRDTSMSIETADITPNVIADARVLLIDATHPLAARHAVRWAREAGTLTIVDVDRPSDITDSLIGEVDVVVVPEPFVAEATGERSLHHGLEQLARRCAYAALVVATCGEKGSVAYDGDRFVTTPASRVSVVDTTGAGDAFRAGLAAALVRLGAEASVDDLLQFANATAALNCRAIGAQAGLPSFDEVRAQISVC